MQQFKMQAQHSQLSFNDIEEMGVDCAVLMSLFNDRMKSSINNGFKDDDGFYIIFTFKEIKDTLNWGVGKITSVMKALKNFNKIITKRPYFNRASHIYLPTFNACYSKIETPEFRKSKPNHSINNHTTVDMTVDTETQTQNKKISCSENEMNLDHAEHKKDINALKTALIEKTKLPADAVEAVIDYANNDYDTAYKVFGIINQAKYRVAKSNDLLNQPVASYENNANIKNKIGWKLRYIFNYAKQAKKPNGYIMNGLKTFFLDAFGLVKDELIEPVAKSQREPKIDIKKPAWMDEPYDAEAHKISDAEKKRIQAKLDAFYKQKDAPVEKPIKKQPKRETKTFAEFLADSPILGN